MEELAPASRVGVSQCIEMIWVLLSSACDIFVVKFAFAKDCQLFGLLVFCHAFHVRRESRRPKSLGDWVARVVEVVWDA